MLKNIHETLAPLLRDPEFQREYILTAFDEDGPDGVLRALEDIARATANGHADSRNGSLTAQDFLSRLQALGLDWSLTTTDTASIHS